MKSELFKKSFIRILFSANLFLDAIVFCFAIIFLLLWSNYGTNFEEIIQVISQMKPKVMSSIIFIILILSFLLVFTLRLMIPKFKLSGFFTDRNVDYFEYRILQNENNDLILENTYLKNNDLILYMLCDILENEENRRKLDEDEINKIIEQTRIFSRYMFNDYSEELNKFSSQEKIEMQRSFINVLNEEIYPQIYGVSFKKRNHMENK